MAYNELSTSTVYSAQYAQKVERISDGFSDGHGVFIYRSTHAHGDIEATGFFADGKRHGLKVGDLLCNIAYSSAGSSAATWHVVSASTGAVSAASSDSAAAHNQAFNVTVTPATT